MRIVLAFLLLLSSFAFAAEPQMLETRDVIALEGKPDVAWTVEVAATAKEQSTGLMHRASMPPRTGMLFDFGTTRPVSMWMRNTLIPLDMVFVCGDGTIARVARAEPLDESIVPSGEPVRYVLEINAGEAAPAGLRRGARLTAKSGGYFRHEREEGDTCGR